MPDIANLKKVRSNKLSTFTRKLNSLRANLDASSPLDACQEAYNNLVTAYSALEEAHDDYVLAVDEQVIMEEGDYLLIPSQQLTENQIKVSKLKEAKGKIAKDEDDEKKAKQLEDTKKKDKRAEFESTKAEFDAGLMLFIDPCTQLKNLQDSSIGAEDFRKEVDRVSDERDCLKQLLEKMIGMYPEIDMGGSVASFKKDVEDVYQVHFDRCTAVSQVCSLHSEGHIE